MPSVAELILKIVGKDESAAALKSVSGNLKALQTAGTIAGGAMVGLGAGALKVGNDFDQMTDAIAAGTGATGDQLKDLNSTALDVFKSMPVSMQDAGTAIADLNTRLGLTGDELKDVSKDFLDFSRVSGADLPGSIRDLTRVMGDWGIEAEDSSLLLDKIFKGSQATGIGVDKLSQSVVQFGAPLRGMGFTIDESIALLGKWEKEGVNTELVLGSMRIAMGKFAKDGVPMREGLEDTIAKIQELGPSAEATALAMDVFGARAGADMAAAILEGRFELGEMVKVIEDAEGAVETTAGEMDDWREKLKVLKNQVIGSIAPHADLAGAILSAGGSATLMASNIGRVIPALGAMGPAMQAAAVGAKALGLAMLTPPLGIIIALVAVGVAAYIFRDQIADAFRAVWKVVGPILENVTGALGDVVSWVQSNWPIIAALLTGPIGLAVLGIVKYWDEIKSGVTDAANAVLDFLKGNWPEIASIILLPFAPLIILATDAFGIRSALIGAFTEILDFARGFLSDMVGWATDLASGILDALVALPGALFDLAEDAFTQFWDAAKGVWTEMAAWVTALPGKILSAIGDLGRLLWDKGRELIQGFIDGMKSIPIPNPLDMVPGGGIIKKGGGLVGKGLGKVGFAEGLWEVPGPRGAGDIFPAMLSPGEMVVPAREADALRAGGGGGLNITFNGPLTVAPVREAKQPREMAADVAFAVAAQLRARGVWVPV